MMTSEIQKCRTVGPKNILTIVNQTILDMKFKKPRKIALIDKPTQILVELRSHCIPVTLFRKSNQRRRHQMLEITNVHLDRHVLNILLFSLPPPYRLHHTVLVRVFIPVRIYCWRGYYMLWDILKAHGCGHMCLRHLTKTKLNKKSPIDTCTLQNSTAKGYDI